MAAAAACPSELAAAHGRPNVSLLAGTRPCNRSSARPSPYTPQATAAFAVAITAMMLVTIVGNVLVIMAVLTSRSLRGAQNLFLVSLAAADILVATLVIPFSLANELQGYWAFSAVWCEIYLALDVLFCTSSIVHLCAIALDRYLSISRPVAYGAKRHPERIKAAIVVVWLIAAVISFPPLLTLDKHGGGQEACELNSERWYILYSTVGSFFAPCVIMILVYVRIYQIAKRHARGGPAGQSQRAPAGGNAGAATMDARGERDEASPPKGNRAEEEVAEGTPEPRPSPPQTPEDAAAVAAPRSGAQTTPEVPQEAGGRSAPRLSRRFKTAVLTPAGTRLVPEEACPSPATPASRRKALMKREKRFTVVLAAVMGVFVACWFPFFLSYALQAVCPRACAVPEPLFKFFFWMGYCNSALNPVIYTAFNRDFRKAFKRILSRAPKATPT